MENDAFPVLSKAARYALTRFEPDGQNPMQYYFTAPKPGREDGAEELVANHMASQIGRVDYVDSANHARYRLEQSGFYAMILLRNGLLPGAQDQEVNKLEECPFCSEDRSQMLAAHHPFGTEYYVSCPNCKARGPFCASTIGAEALWNGTSKKRRDVPVHHVETPLEDWAEEAGMAVAKALGSVVNAVRITAAMRHFKRQEGPVDSYVFRGAEHAPTLAEIIRKMVDMGLATGVPGKPNESAYALTEKGLEIRNKIQENFL